jgi:hypothetical protein
MSDISLATLSVIKYAEMDIDELRELKEQLLEKVLSLADMRRRIADDMAQDMLEEQMNEYMIYVRLVDVWIRKFYARG